MGKENFGSIVRRKTLIISITAFAVILLINPWSYKSFIHINDRLIPIIDKALLIIDIIIFILIGIVLFYKQKSIVPLIEILFDYLIKGMKIALYLLYLVVILEVSSYLFYKIVLSKEWEHRIHTATGQQIEPSLKVAMYIPDLLTNFKHNPASLKNNEYGWRYGGGPKKSSVRILCLGGSTTFSSNASTGDLSYPGQMERYLREKGYDVEVVNGGMVFYSSVEALNTLNFRGVYLEPDIIIFHTGLNDIEPLMSPYPYRPDYSHWRVGGGLAYQNRLFSEIWENISSWAIKLTALLLYRPMSGQKEAHQVTHFPAEFRAKTDISKRYPTGLARNLVSMVAISRSIGAEPVLMTFKQKLNHPNSILNNCKLADKALEASARERWRLAQDKCIAVIDSVAKTSETVFIPFHKFEASDEQKWTDHCHLDEQGLLEKAQFVGDRIIESGILDDVMSD